MWHPNRSAAYRRSARSPGPFTPIESHLMKKELRRLAQPELFLPDMQGMHVRNFALRIDGWLNDIVIEALALVSTSRSRRRSGD